MKNNIKCLLFCFIFTWSVLPGSVCLYGQSKSLEVLVSLSTVNQPVAVALDQLSRNSGFTFSYNPDHIDALNPVSVSFVKVPLIKVLEAIVPADDFGYKVSGRKVVLYKLKDIKPINLPEERESVVENKVDAPVTLAKVAIQPDTVYITKTEIRTDTITRVDTITKYDTVFILKTVNREKPITSEDIFSDLSSLRKELKREFTVEAGFSLSWLSPVVAYSADEQYNARLEDYRRANSNSPISGSINFDFRLRYARFSIESGIAYTAFNQKFDFNYKVKTGGFYLKDTLDIYYTIAESDTAWYYVLDSTYQPVDVKDYRYVSDIKHHYIDLPLAFQYNQPLGRALLYGKACIITSVHAGSKGLFLHAEELEVSPVSDLEFKPVNFSWLLGAGAILPLNKNVTFNVGIVYRKQLQGIYTHFAIDKRLSATGINAGVCFRF